MASIVAVFSLVLGLCIGGVAVWFVCRTKLQQIRERTHTEINTERATLIERLQHYEHQANYFKDNFDAREQDLARFSQALSDESARRAVAEEKAEERQARLATIAEEVHRREQNLVQLSHDFTDEATKRAAAERGAEERLNRVIAVEGTLAEKDDVIAAFQDVEKIHKAQIAELSTKLTEERKAAGEKLAMLDDAQQKLSDAFKALCADALSSNNQSFLHLASTKLAEIQEAVKGDLEKRQTAITEIVKPVRESLDKFDTRIQGLEIARVEAYTSLTEQVKSLQDTQRELRSETSNLVKAMRSPVVRGRWGEIQLKRVVELAGMIDHCDFTTQATVMTLDGNLRPDLVVRLPGQKNIVIDAKAPLEAYLEAIETTDEVMRTQHLQRHARQIRAHMAALAKKAYWEQFKPTPEFVVLFLPGETFFSAALEHDPALIEAGIGQQVILATPTTLIALLHAVSYGWRQENIAQNAQEISKLGKDLYERLASVAGHWSKVGKHLSQSIESYNAAVGSLETRVLVSARRFKALDTTSLQGEIIELEQADIRPRILQAPELLIAGATGGL